MRKLLTLTAAMALAAGVIIQAQQATQQAPPAQAKPDEPAKSDDKDKPAAKTPPSIVGKWNVVIEMQGGNGPMNTVLDMKLDGKAVTGTITGPQGDPLAIKGEFADGKLSFSMSFDSPNGPVPITFNGAFKENGSLAGTMDFGPAGQGMQVTWTGERAKEK